MKTISELRERLDWLDAERKTVMDEFTKLCRGDESAHAHAPQMKRSGRVEYNHQVEGTE